MKNNNIKKSHICHSGKKTNYMKTQIQKTIKDFSNNSIIMNELHQKYKTDKNITLNDISNDISNIYNKVNYSIKSKVLLQFMDSINFENKIIITVIVIEKLKTKKL